MSLIWENNAIFSPTALLFESVRNPEEDHNLKPLKTDILLDDAFDF